MDGGFNFVFDWTANSKTVNEDTTFEFIPPVYSGCASSLVSCHFHVTLYLVLPLRGCTSEALGMVLEKSCADASAGQHLFVDRGSLRSVLRRFTVKGGRFCLWIYAVPVSESCTRLIINAGGNFPKPKPAGGLKGLKARLSPQPLIRCLLRQLRWMSTPVTVMTAEQSSCSHMVIPVQHETVPIMYDALQPCDVRHRR